MTPSHWRRASGRECKQALVKAIAAATESFLVDDRGSDLPDDMLALGDYSFEVQRFPGNEFYIRAKPLDECGAPANMSAIQFEVKITGGG